MGTFPSIDHDTLYEHLYNIYVDHRPAKGQHLGYVDKTRDTIGLSLPLSGIDVTVKQSLSALSSTTQTSSTGFVCWQLALLFADWVLGDLKCPISLNQKVVVELGAGVSGLLASVLGPLTDLYVATDQKHILKLLKKIFVENVTTTRFTSSTVELDSAGPKHQPDQVWPSIDVMELDWERLEHGTPQVLATLPKRPDFILACDTVYNSYLIPFFLGAARALAGPHTVLVVALQLRDELVMEQFLECALDNQMEVSVVPDEVLSPALIQGFVVYYIRVNPGE